MDQFHETDQIIRSDGIEFNPMDIILSYPRAGPTH